MGCVQLGCLFYCEEEMESVSKACLNRAVRSGAAGAAPAAPLFVEKFVIIARVHSLLSGATPH